MKTRLASVSQRHALVQALKPYRYYNRWIKSKACFLTPQEIALISLYQQTGSYHTCCGLLQKSIIEVSNLLMKTILRLKAWLFLYQRWEQKQAWLDKMYARYCRHIERKLRHNAQRQRKLPGRPP